MNKTTIFTCAFLPVLALGLLVVMSGGDDLVRVTHAVWDLITATVGLGASGIVFVFHLLWVTGGWVLPICAGLAGGTTVRDIQFAQTAGNSRQAAVCGLVSGGVLTAILWAIPDSGLMSLPVIIGAAGFRDVFRPASRGSASGPWVPQDEAERDAFEVARKAFFWLTGVLTLVVLVGSTVSSHLFDHRGYYADISYTLGMSPEEIAAMDEKFKAARRPTLLGDDAFRDWLMNDAETDKNTGLDDDRWFARAMMPESGHSISCYKQDGDVEVYHDWSAATKILVKRLCVKIYAADRKTPAT